MGWKQRARAVALARGLTGQAMDELAALVEELDEKNKTDECFDSEHKAPGVFRDVLTVF